MLSTRDILAPDDRFQDGVMQMFDWMWGFSRPLEVPVPDIVHRLVISLGIAAYNNWKLDMHERVGRSRWKC